MTSRGKLLPVLVALALLAQASAVKAIPLIFEFEGSFPTRPGAQALLSIQFDTMAATNPITVTQVVAPGVEVDLEGISYPYDSARLELLGLPEHTGVLTGGGGLIETFEGVFVPDIGIAPDIWALTATVDDFGIGGKTMITATLRLADSTLGLFVPAVISSTTRLAPLMGTDNALLFLDFGRGLVISSTLTAVASRSAIPEPRALILIMVGLSVLGLLAHAKRRASRVG